MEEKRMTARRYTRPLAIAALLGVLAASNVVPTHAATPVPDGPTHAASYRYGQLGPPVPPTRAQLADHAQRLAAYQAEVAQVARASGRVRPDGDPGYYGGFSGSVSVTPSLELGQSKYFNYSGVVSSLTVDSNWTNNLPTIDQMGAYEHVNQYIPGTRFSDMIGPINQCGNTGGFYIIQTATSQGQFNNFIGSDIYNSGAQLITDIRT
jgi:hypothetical protein